MDQYSSHFLSRRAWRFAAICLLLLSAALAWAQPERNSKNSIPAADVIISHAKIYTVNSKQPWAESVAIRGDKILAVGSNSEISRYRGGKTQVIDAQRRLLLPGFVDSHIHFMDGSLSLTRVNLEGTKNVAEIQAKVKEYAAAHPAHDENDAWILGRGWTYAEFGSETLPNKKHLDEIVPDRPVALEGFDGHSYWVNSKALALAGIMRDTANPANGEIVRDAKTGEATGALKESAYQLVEKVIPKPTRDERLAALRLGIGTANQAGLTRVHSCGGDFEYLDLWDQLRRSGQLTLRMYMGYFLDPPQLRPEDVSKIEDARRRFPASNPWIEGGAVKMMLDGVVESHTAAMLTPYADDPTQKGKMFWEPAKYKQAVATLDRSHLQIFTHAIGDGAVRLALDAYQEAREKNQTYDARHRIEHIETITAADVPRFGALGVIASFQPLHAYPDDDTLKVWLRNAGPDREPRAWAWQGIARTGGRLAFGSDWPVVTLNPWQGIQNAVTRQTREGLPPGGWVPQQRLSLEQAIEGYTLGAAFGGHREKAEGSIEAGKLADMILVSQDLFSVDPHKIAATEVLLTLVGGKTVYQSPKWGPQSAARPEKNSGAGR